MECPFCHSSNSTESHFCNTCGHRLPPLNSSAPEKSAGERNQLGKLHSPLLSGGYEEDLENQDISDFSRSRPVDRLSPSLLRHSSTNPISPSTSSIDNKTNRLRSPLLEPAKPEPVEIPVMLPRKEEYEALRSPFLSAPFPITPTPGTAPANNTAAPTDTTPIDTNSGISQTSSPRSAISWNSPVPSPTSPALQPPVAPADSFLSKPSSQTPSKPSSSSELQQRYSLRESTDKISSLAPNESAAAKPYAILALLFIATVLKIWFINQYWGQMVIVVDQIAQLLVIVSVAGLCLASGRNKPR